MFRKKSGNRKGASAKAKKRCASMLDIIALTASLVFILAACAAAKNRETTAVSPAVSDNAVTTVASTAVIPSTAPLPDAPYPAYLLENKYGGPVLHLGVQTGSYPWGIAFNVNDETFHTSGDMPGVTFCRFDGDQFRLFFHQIKATGKDVISTFMTTSDTYRTVRGIQRGDSVEKLLEAYNGGLLWQPEPFPVSLDLGGDFCVYDELFVYTRPEDDNCCICFYVASRIDGAIDSKFITGIQISLGQDGGPAYIADDVNTFTVDYANLEQYLKTDTGDEDDFNRLFRAQVPTSDIFEAMTDINWHIYCQLYPDDTVNAINWLYSQKYTDERHILCVLKATKGLDSAFSEGYAGVLANIYRADSRTFIRAAAQLSDSQIDAATKLLCFDLSQYRDDVTAELEAYQERGDLNDMERRVISEILHYLELLSADQ